MIQLMRTILKSQQYIAMEKEEDQKKSVGIFYRALNFLVRTFPLYIHRQISKGRGNSSLGRSEGTEEGKVTSSLTAKYETQEEKKEALEEEELKNRGRSRILRPVKQLTRVISNINEKSHAYIEDKKRSFASQ
ncbi:hypothetical protein FCM35_KLT20389 [Carex littledalei]|uniref:Uncharacterized protein n=1 Tax=Carex littledalei TaxID=544730 RepID=A0A833R7C8_9POAL|nr:hypothetical protein FCM35_KLT20389 [Carex littledalei]